MNRHTVKIIFLIACAFAFSKAAAQVTFVIDHLPKATPLEDTIYVSGTFNDWAVTPEVMLRRRLDGKYTIQLPKGQGSFEYKFHRGNWSKAETDAHNQYRPNRQFKYGNGETIHIIIENWQDVGGAKPFDIFIFYFFTVAFLGLLTPYFLVQIKNQKKQVTQPTLTFLSFLCVILLGRVFVEIVPLTWQGYAGLIAEIALFLGGPLWYFIFFGAYLGRLPLKTHFIPALLVGILTLFKLFNLSSLAFLNNITLNKLLTWDTLLIYGSALISMTIYFFLGMRIYTLMSRREDVVPTEHNYYRYLVYSAGLFLLVLFMKILLVLLEAEKALFWFNKNILFTSISFFVLIIWFYVFKHEDIFKQQQIFLRSDDLETLKTLLHNAMREKKVFTNPQLTINDLAEILNMKPYLVSKVINEYYDQNFRDFVNKYRVEEFILLAQQESNKKYTYLALAFEVGFNSKSTFNAAFKKFTNLSPREYFGTKKTTI